MAASTHDAHLRSRSNSPHVEQFPRRILPTLDECNPRHKAILMRRIKDLERRERWKESGKINHRESPANLHRALLKDKIRRQVHMISPSAIVAFQQERLDTLRKGNSAKEHQRKFERCNVALNPDRRAVILGLQLKVAELKRAKQEMVQQSSNSYITDETTREEIEILLPSNSPTRPLGNPKRMLEESELGAVMQRKRRKSSLSVKFAPKHEVVEEVEESLFDNEGDLIMNVEEKVDWWTYEEKEVKGSEA